MSPLSVHHWIAGNTELHVFVINANNITELQADSTIEDPVAVDANEPIPAENASDITSGEGNSEPNTVQDEGKVPTEEQEATTVPEEADPTSASPPTDDDLATAPPENTQATEVVADVTHDESIVPTESVADMGDANYEPSEEAIIAPIEVVTAETEANGEDVEATETMQDISDWEKDEDNVSDLEISDWEKDDADASSQAGESETNPSEHQDYEDDRIAQEASEPTPETEKPSDQQEREEQVQQIDTEASVPPIDVAVEDDAVPTEVTEAEQTVEDTSTTREPEVSEQNDVTQQTEDQTKDEEPSSSDPAAEPPEPPETITPADTAAADQKPIQVEIDTPNQDDVEAAKSTTGIEDAIGTTEDVSAPTEPHSDLSQPDASKENNITDSSTDAQEDATAHESPADDLEPAVNDEAAKDSEQAIVSAAPDDVENPDACTGTYLLCFFCFTSLCRMHFFSLAQLRTFPR